MEGEEEADRLPSLLHVRLLELRGLTGVLHVEHTLQEMLPRNHDPVKAPVISRKGSGKAVEGRQVKAEKVQWKVKERQ